MVGRGSRSSLRDAAGFSLIEILVVVGMVSVIAAVAIPVTLSQQARAANASTKASLTSVVSAIDTQLAFLRGAPPEALNICHTQATYPSGTPAANTCAAGQWEAKRVSNGASLSPAFKGSLSGGVLVQGRIASDGSYCVDASNERAGTDALRYVSATGEVETGTCREAAWSATGSVSGSSGVTGPGSLPAQPTGVTTAVNAGAGSVTVKWNAQAGVTYSVKVSGQAAKKVTATSTGLATCVFPADTCTGTPNGPLGPGPYTAAVQAMNADGRSQDATADFEIEGTAAQVIAKVDMHAAANPAPVAIAESVRENLIANPSWEAGSAGTWFVHGGTVTVEPMTTVAGTKVMKVATPGTAHVSVSRGVRGSRMPVVPGHTYTFSFYAKAAAGSPTSSQRGYIYWYDRLGNQLSSINSSAPITTADWTRISVTGTAPADAVGAGALIYYHRPGNGSTFYYDGAMFERADFARPYFDGETNDAYWTGAKNASESVANLPNAARGRVKVSWSEPAEALGKDVTYTVVSDPGQHTCSIVSATTCYVEGLDDDTEYTFTVTAVTDAGAGRPGTTIAMRTPPAPAAPAALPGKVTNVVATPVAPAGSIKLTWKGNSAGSANTDYLIERSSGTGGWQEVSDGVSTATTFTDTGLVPNRTYQYRVYGKNEVGMGTASDSVALGASKFPDPATAAAALRFDEPTGAAVLKVNAQPATDSGAVDWVTGYSTSGSLSTPADLPSGTSGSVACTTSTCTITWPNIASQLNRRTYFYAFPVNLVGHGTPYKSSLGAPTAVRTLTATPDGSAPYSVALRWTAPADNRGIAITQYRVEKSVNNGPWVSATTFPGTATSGSVGGLALSPTRFRVLAYNGTPGEWSNTSAQVSPYPPFNQATGGQVTDVPNYNGYGQTWRVHRFTSSSTFQVQNSIKPFRVLVVAGGGGGAGGAGNNAQGAMGGSGGAGGVIERWDVNIPVGSHSVAVGAAGRGCRGGWGCQGQNGGNSSLYGILAYGGGGGGTVAPGRSGGSGGGGGSLVGNWGGPWGGGAGVAGQGKNGGPGRNQGVGGAGGTMHWGSIITGSSRRYSPGDYGNGGGGCGYNCSGGSGTQGVVIVAYQIS